MAADPPRGSRHSATGSESARRPHTDGLVEAPNEHAVQFGEVRLRNTLDEAAAEPLPELKRAVLEAVRKHTNDILRHDDVTLLAIEVR